MGLPFITANARFEFSRTMNHPTATAPVDVETWESAPGFYESKVHWLLGHEPSWVECWFHAGTDHVFPWTRARLSDEYGVIAIYRLDQVTEEFGDRGRVWKAYGRDALYGTVDNYMRSPRISTQPGATDADPGYTEWPVVPPGQLVSCETLLRQADGDTTRFDYQNCLLAVDCTGAGTPVDCTFKTDADRDTILSGLNAESNYSTQPDKLGPNYTGKGVRRGWVFKDIHRHSAGSAEAESRPILGVYNRSDSDLDSDVIDSNFSQAQAGGSGANALARDVSISWPWAQSDAPAVPGGNSLDDPVPVPSTETIEAGYDYRHVWPGKADQFAVSGQALEVFQRGGLEWDDSVCFSCGERTPGGGCPNGKRLCYFVTCTPSPFVRPSHEMFDHFPTRAEAIGVAETSANPLIVGTQCVISVFDSALGTYSYAPPGSLTEWIGRHQLRQIPVRRTEFTNDSAGPYIVRDQPVGRAIGLIGSSACQRGPGCPDCEGKLYAFPSIITEDCEGQYDCFQCSEEECPPDPRCSKVPPDPCCLPDLCYICPQFCFPCNQEFTDAECVAGGCDDPFRLIVNEAVLDRVTSNSRFTQTPVWSMCNGTIRVCRELGAHFAQTGSGDEGAVHENEIVSGQLTFTAPNKVTFDLPSVTPHGHNSDVDGNIPFHSFMTWGFSFPGWEGVITPVCAGCSTAEPGTRHVNPIIGQFRIGETIEILHTANAENSGFFTVESISASGAIGGTGAVMTVVERSFVNEGHLPANNFVHVHHLLPPAPAPECKLDIIAGACIAAAEALNVEGCPACVRADPSVGYIEWEGSATFLWMTPTLPAGIPEVGGECFGTGEPIAVWTSNEDPDADLLCYEPSG